MIDKVVLCRQRNHDLIIACGYFLQRTGTLFWTMYILNCFNYSNFKCEDNSIVWERKNGSLWSGRIPTSIHEVIMIVEVKQGLSSKSGNFNTGSDALQACASILVSTFPPHIGLRSSIPRIAGSYKFFYQKQIVCFLRPATILFFVLTLCYSSTSNTVKLKLKLSTKLLTR